MTPIWATWSFFFGRQNDVLARITERSKDDYDNDVSDNCDHNFGTFDDFGVKNDQKVSHNMILMSKYKEQHGGKNRSKNSGKALPPPFFQKNCTIGIRWLPLCKPWFYVLVHNRSVISARKPSYAQKNYSSDHKWNKLEYNNGDLNTSIIKTSLGRTIMVQWDETSPRPYSRHNLIQGTKGILAGFPTRVALDGGVEGITKNHHSWAQGEDLEKLYEKYDHPLYKRVGEEARRMGGHGGMDFIMRFRIIECLRKGTPLDQNVYEGCFWSAVTPLSADSILNDGAPQKFPDFTRGNWKSTNQLDIIS